MPQHNVTQAFHYAAGGTVTRYRKGVQSLPPAVAEHALAHGFIAADQPKPRRIPAVPAKAEETTHGTD